MYQHYGVCPNCGHCPLCGRSCAQPYFQGPIWINQNICGGLYPQPTWGYDNSAGGNYQMTIPSGTMIAGGTFVPSKNQ